MPPTRFSLRAVIADLCDLARSLKTVIAQQFELIKGLKDMTTALERLTASVDRAVAEAAKPIPNDDASLNALSDKLDAAFPPPAVDPAPVAEDPAPEQPAV